MEATLRTAISDILKTLGLGDVAFVVEHPDEVSHGDYATNVALIIAKQMGKSPRECAEMIVTALTEKKLPHVLTITIAGPGFINITLTRDFFRDAVTHVLAEKERWGSNQHYDGKKVIVEYTDPNPFKEMHIGHVMTNAIGESISRLVEVSGADVHRANYQGDVGMHVAKAVYGMQERGIGADHSCSPKELGKAYALGARAYEEDASAKATIVELNKKIYERSDEHVNALYDMGRRVSLEYFEEIYAILGTRFDHYFFESEAGPLGKQLVLDNPTVFPESDGARIFRGEEYGLHTRVFLNKEGLPTYEAKELGLAKTKYDAFPYDHSIVVTANEINEYFKVLLRAMECIYPELADKTEHIGHGMLKLTTGKMSSRTGDVIAALDFLRELADMAAQKMAARDMPVEDKEEVARMVAVAATKYVVLKGSVAQDVIFDPEESLSFEGASGPYLQYTAVRAQSALDKAAALGIAAATDLAPDTPYDIERVLYRFPEVVLRAATDREPHHVTTYLTELAAAFNSFYAHERIADAADQYAPYKVALTSAVRQTLINGLWLLGITVPEHM